MSFFSFTQPTRSRAQGGFTLTEVMLVLSIFLLFVSVIFTNVMRPQQATALASATTNVLADLRSQQLKSMLGEAENGTSADVFGVHFDTSSYTLFRGTTYTAGNAANFTVTLDPAINFVSNTFPSSQVIFNRQSGEVQGYNAATDSVIIRNIQTNEQRRLEMNRYGVVTIQ